MSSYIIEITDLSGNIGTVETLVDNGLRYTDKLNEINEGEIRISGSSSVKRSLFEVGAAVIIKRDGVLEFSGFIQSKSFLDAGGIKCTLMGKEFRLAQEKGAFANSPYTNTASATVNADIIGESSYFTAGTIDAGSNIDIRFNDSQSLWNALGNLAKKVVQDINVDYVNDEIDILDHRGSTTSVASFNDGIQIDNMRADQSLPKANYVVVKGKGDGVNQIVSSSSNGQNAGSQSTYGVIKEIVTDKSVISQSEANALADSLVAEWKDPIKIYDFNVLNPAQTVIAGDIITITSKDKDINNEEVRITGIARGIRAGKEFLEIQVANPAFARLAKKRMQLMGELRKQQIDADTYMQGSGNTLTFPRGINAKLGAPLRLPFYIPSSWISDEAGNIRVNSMTVDYDLDEYRKGIGTASETDVAPDLSTGNTVSHKHDAADSGHAHGLPTMTSDSFTHFNAEGSDAWAENVRNFYDFVAEVTGITGAFDFIYVMIEIEEDLWSGTDTLQIRVDVAGVEKLKLEAVPFSSGNSPWRQVFVLDLFSSISNQAVALYLSSAAENDYQGVFTVYTRNVSHSHDITGFNADSDNAAVTDANKTPGLSGNSEDHNHSVSIGDGISESGSVNATEVDIFLDFWNGSAWINKHSIINTGATLETDVDITNSGTYPDVAGYWRVRIEPNNAAPDYTQAIVRIKHSLDN